MQYAHYSSYQELHVSYQDEVEPLQVVSMYLLLETIPLTSTSSVL